MAVDRLLIEVKAMLIAPNEDRTAHAVTLNPPTAENPHGYHRLIGGGVEFGEHHQHAIIRELAEEFGATVRGLTFLTAVENIFLINGTVGHEIVFLYCGRLHPPPAKLNATLTESDGTTVPVEWRSFCADEVSLPFYPGTAEEWVRRISDGAR